MSSASPAAGEAKPPKPPKKFIKSTVTVHDRTQLEAVFDYYLFRGPGEKAQPDKRLNYRVDAFFFFPRQFGLNAATYPKHEFYNDIRPLIRFREPKLGFKRMRGLKVGAESPLTYLKSYVASLRRGQAVELEQNAVAEVRVFACSLVSNLLKSIDGWRKRFEALRKVSGPVDPVVTADYFARMTRLLQKVHDTLGDFRDLRTEASHLPDGVGQELRNELSLVDEYCYYRLRDGLAYLLLVAEGWRHDETVPEILAFNQSVMTMLSLHDDHAARSGFMLVGPESTESVKERYLRRRGELKRRIWTVLFLDLRTVALFTFQQQMGPMIAAGLAAFWAVVAQFVVVRNALMQDDISNLWGISGILFLVLAVMAYIIKDRIKEISRSYFRAGLFRRLPDHSERIYYEDRKGESRIVGSLREVAKFERTSGLPKAVTTIRAIHASIESLEHDEEDGVLHYTKDVRLASDIKILDRYPLRAVHDILRFNIDACLPRLGEPTRTLNVIDGFGEVQAVSCPKVYYFDMALQYSLVTKAGTETAKAVDYFRLVVDKNGLVRVERLS